MAAPGSNISSAPALAGSVTRRILTPVAVLVASLVVAGALAGRAAAACGNPVACENQKTGDPPGDWQVSGAGDATIQGYATSMSVDVGQTESFKIDTPSTNYHIDILRLGYYDGDGARMIQSDIKPSVSLPQTQPPCLEQSGTGLIDCGNWSVSASWTVPSDAVSGVYIAHLVRDDAQDKGGDSQIIFVVRNDASHSDILVQTSDETWEAYNDYGGNSLYSCTVDCPSGNPLDYKGAAAVSYNRPLDGDFKTDDGDSDPYYAEYQMIRFLEENGYDVSYTSGSDVDGNGALLRNHKIFISSGHDEYWSPGQRSNVQAALAAGVNEAFFSGNEVFWKTRWGPSIDGSNTPDRTLTSYKETHYNAQVDPQDPPTWTGAWADPRFSLPADGGQPANALTGQQFIVNSGSLSLTVPSTYSKLRFWRNTAVAKLAAGSTATLAPNESTVGYEWDVDQDNGFRPPGEFDVSSTSGTDLQDFTDYGSDLISDGTATHHISLYRAPSGALVFGAGTVQWSWGLDTTNAWGSSGPDASFPPDASMQQATINLFGDMGAQPTTLISGMTAPAKSTDTSAPTSVISSPAAGATVSDLSSTTIRGTATDAGGGVVAGVEVSTDGGTTWHPATITGQDTSSVNWTYTWAARSEPTTTIMSRAVDDSGNVEKPSAGITVNVTCPCSLWNPSATPATPDAGDGSAVTVGTSFSSDQSGTITGIRFYKSAANGGTHIGGLYTTAGTLLASATFTGESATGWQQVSFSSPVPIQPHTTYIAAYYAPEGHYSGDADYWFSPSPTGGNVLNSPPLHALAASSTTNNGWFSYGEGLTFPSSTFDDSNYWIGPVFMPNTGPPGAVSGVHATAGNGTADLTWTAPQSGGTPDHYVITPYVGSTAQSTTTVDATQTSAHLQNLTNGTTYTFTVTATNDQGAGPESASSNPVTPDNAPPGPPSDVTAAAASQEARVSWSAPTDTGGAAITGYTVTPHAGATAGTSVDVGAGTTTTTVSGLTDGTAYTFTVSATNANGTGPDSDASAAVTPEDTLFDFATPAVLDASDSGSVELGVKVTPSTDGMITGIRFYKSPANTSTHVASLWSAAGTLLASGTFTNETSSGWQNLTFASPVPVTAGNTYVAGYLSNAHYSYTSNAFVSPLTNGPLTAPASANGVYAYSQTSTFPNSSYNATSYGVDVDFQPGGSSSGGSGPPDAPSGVRAVPASNEASVSWSAPANTCGGPISSYTITPYAGSTAQPSVQASATTTSATVTGLTDGQAYTFKVTANNASGAGPESDASPAVTPEDTILDLTTPSVADGGDGSSVELGVKFTASVDGAITGIRFFKSAANTGAHVGSLWTASGALLASGTFTGETSSGWQMLQFSSPVAVSAGTTYIAGYLAPNGHYTFTDSGFSSAVINGPLSAVANGVSPNGVFSYASKPTMPSQSFDAANYWVDVLFQPGGGGAPSAPTGVSASPASGQAMVSWSAPADPGSSPITAYTVTPYKDGVAGTPTQVPASTTSTDISGLTDGTAYTFTVTARNAVGTGTESDPSSPTTPEDTIFDFATPSSDDAGDSSPVELGVKFTPTQDGQITGIRFYKSVANTGTHVGTLWTSDGQQLASGTFTGETSSGWQTLQFSSPVTVAASTTYVAGYFTPTGHYAASPGGFASGVDNGPLQADANSTSANGVFSYGSSSTFPTGSYGATNYWVDVLFDPSN